MDEAELHAQILANPVADEPRRKLGELLKAKGDPRGAFILLQLRIGEIHRSQGPLDELAELTPQERQLIARHGAEWSKDVRPLVRTVVFRRGFVEGIEIDASDFLAHGAELFQRAPILHLQLRKAAGVMPELCASPLLARIRSLNLEGAAIGDDGARALAESPHLSQLTWLDLRWNKLTRAGLEALCASDKLPGLRWVALTSNDFEDPADQIAEDDADTIYHWAPTPLGQELEVRYGRKAWLHYNPRKAFFWPPRAFAFLGAASAP